MKNKILLTFLSFALVFGVVGFVGTKTVHAQVAPSFPTGCTSNLGYSVTNGTPCNGTRIATMNILGCSNALGYSVLNGVPCDGSTVAIQYLSGCTSIYGFSLISGAACNGNAIAQLSPNITITTGLPVTGAGTNALVDFALLCSLAIVAVSSGLYLAKKIKTTV